MARKFQQKILNASLFAFLLDCVRFLHTQSLVEMRSADAPCRVFHPRFDPTLSVTFLQTISYRVSALSPKGSKCGVLWEIFGHRGLDTIANLR